MPARIPTGTVAHDLRLCFRIALIVMIPLVVYFTSGGTWRLGKNIEGGGYAGRYFRAQAESILQGRLDVKRSDIQSECFDYEGRCYGYFGLTPSLLRLPFLGYMRWVRSSLTPLYLGLAILLGYTAALRMLRRSLLEAGPPDAPSRRAVVWYFVVGALVLGPGGTLMFLTLPAVYEEASAWSLAFFLMTLERVWAWHRTQKTRSLAFAVLFAVAAVNARPTAVTGCAAVGILVAVLSRFTIAPAARTQRRSVLVAAACLALLPALTAGGVFWLKFRTPVPDLRLNEQIPEAPWWADVLRINGDKTGGLIFLPTELVAYLRPDGLIWDDAWPYVDCRFTYKNILWLPPLPRGGAYVEAHTTVTSTMPLAWGVNLVVLLWLGTTGWRLTRGRPPPSRGPAFTQSEWVLAAGLFASAGAMILLVVTTFGVTNRYLADFFSTSVVGMVLGHRVILPILDRRPILCVMAAVAAVLLTGWSVVVTILLSVRLAGL